MTKGGSETNAIRRNWRFSDCLLILAALILGLSLARNIVNISKTKKEVEKIRQKIEATKKENDELEKKVAEATSQENVEKQLRDKLGLAKPGEIVLVMPDAEVLRRLAPKDPVETDVLPDPTWKKWAQLFF